MAEDVKVVMAVTAGDMSVLVPLAALQSAQQQIDRHSTGRPSAPESPKPEVALTGKCRTSALRIIIALAMDGLGYRPDDKKSPIPKQIADYLEAQDIPLDVDTVRTWLKEAAEELPQR